MLKYFNPYIANVQFFVLNLALQSLHLVTFRIIAFETVVYCSVKFSIFTGIYMHLLSFCCFDLRAESNRKGKEEAYECYCGVSRAALLSTQVVLNERCVRFATD